jgi:hypothetical protein
MASFAMAQSAAPTGMQSNTAPTTGAPVMVQPMVVPAPIAGGIIIQGGYATSGPVSAPLVTPPAVAYTPNAAVITNTPTVLVEPSALSAASVAANVAPAPSTTTAPSRGFDWGAAKMMTNSPYNVGTMAQQRSLGEIARENRAHPQHATRTYTNDDIARLNQQTGANNAPAANMPASDQGNSVTVPSAAPAPAPVTPQAQPQQTPTPQQQPAQQPPPQKPSPFGGPK